jgi:uncharacterized repeat protein (TIGR03803 family)
MVFDTQGNLYGTTNGGGDSNGCGYGGCGTVFEVKPNGTETVLHSFTHSPDGAFPKASVVFDAQGNLYGTTALGGAYNQGTVFEVTPSGSETVLYSFTGKADGGTPESGLVFDAHGNLYGTTWGGGDFSDGTVFKLSPAGVETVLHSFTDGLDGGAPVVGMIFDAQGNLYGTTSQGGAYNQGTVFKLTP